MTANYIELRQHLEDRLTQFGHEMPGPMSGFARLHKKAVEDGALSAKVKKLMALAISIIAGCEGCIAIMSLMLSRPEQLGLSCWKRSAWE